MEIDEDAQPPKVELTSQEKANVFVPRPGVHPDLIEAVLSSTFTQFSLPDETEGFDAIEYVWSKDKEAKDYMERWVKARKMTIRVDNIEPSEWFRERLNAFHTNLKDWHTKCETYAAT